MARAAGAFLDALTPARATFPFTDQRVNWHYVPRRRQGVPFKDLPGPARATDPENRFGIDWLRAHDRHGYHHRQA